MWKRQAIGLANGTNMCSILGTKLKNKQIWHSRKTEWQANALDQWEGREVILGPWAMLRVLGIILAAMGSCGMAFFFFFIRFAVEKDPLDGMWRRTLREGGADVGSQRTRCGPGEKWWLFGWQWIVGGQRMFPLLSHGEIGQNELQCVTFRDSRKSLYQPLLVIDFRFLL